MPVPPPSFAKPLPPPPQRERNERFENFLHMKEAPGKSTFEEDYSRLREYLPDVNERLQYHEWYLPPLRRQRDEQYREPVLSPRDYMGMLQTANYNSTQETSKLYDYTLLKYRPVIVIGHSRGITYKVLICSRLQARRIPNDPRELLPENVLGINDNVEPNLSKTLRRRRNQNFPEESTERAESDDYVRDAFHIFHQIGALMYFDGDFKEDPDAATKESEGWKDTGFAVVSNVTSGRSQGVWLVFEFHPFDPVSTDHYHVDTDVDWGWLPNHEGEEDPTDEQFASAKIADSLQDLGPDYEFKLEHKLLHEPEIVRALLTPDGQILRQAIDHNSLGRGAVS